MIDSFRQLDALLHGNATTEGDLRAGKVNVGGRKMLAVVAVLGGFYGLCMGCYGLVGGHDNAVLQMLASAAKVPLLFVLTLAVTLPSLYVFNALLGGRLRLTDMLRLILAAIAIMLAVLAGFGTIVAFFSFTTESYPFMKLLNVLIFTVAGVIGLGYLRRTLAALAGDRPAPEEDLPPPATEIEPAGQPEIPPQPGEPFERTYAPVPPRKPRPAASPATTLFRIWVVVFAVVGAQMSWVLRPFLGAPGLEFELFREREGNFFMAVVNAAGNLLGL